MTSTIIKIRQTNKNEDIETFMNIVQRFDYSQRKKSNRL